jgi:hypothetical protein
MTVTIVKHIGGFVVEWHPPEYYNMPAPPGMWNKRVYTNLSDALDFARSLLKDKED